MQANILTLARLQKGLNQTQVAQATGYSLATVSNVENRRTTPSFTLGFRLCKLLDIPFEDMAAFAGACGSGKNGKRR